MLKDKTPMASQTVLPHISPEETQQENWNGGAEEWVVIVYNNEYNTYPQVIAILMRATKCTRDEAEMETWEIDNLGKSVVHHASEEECNRAASIIRTIGIQVEVKQE